MNFRNGLWAVAVLVLGSPRRHRARFARNQSSGNRWRLVNDIVHQSVGPASTAGTTGPNDQSDHTVGRNAIADDFTLPAPGSAANYGAFAGRGVTTRRRTIGQGGGDIGFGFSPRPDRARASAQRPTPKGQTRFKTVPEGRKRQLPAGGFASPGRGDGFLRPGTRPRRTCEHDIRRGRRSASPADQHLRSGTGHPHD